MIYHMAGGGGAPIDPPAPTFSQEQQGSYLGISASYTIPAGRVLKETTKSSVYIVGTQAGTTVNPGTQTITAVPANKFTTGTVYVAGDSNLVSPNIVSGKSIFGVAGSAFSFTGGESKIIDVSAAQLMTPYVGWQDSFFVGAKMVMIENTYAGGTGTVSSPGYIRSAVVFAKPWTEFTATYVYSSYDNLPSNSLIGAGGSKFLILDSSTGTIFSNETRSSYFQIPVGAFICSKWY